MRIRSIFDLVITTIVWFPILAVIVFFVGSLVVGAMHLEVFTSGTEVFIPDHSAPSRPVGTGFVPVPLATIIAAAY